MNFTDAWIRSLGTLKDREEFFDDSFNSPPLTLRVMKTGRKTFYTSYKSPVDYRNRRRKLGVYPVVTLKDARSLSVETHRAVSEGVDPVLVVKAEKQRDRVDTIGALFRAFLNDAAFLKNSENHKKQMRGSINNDVLPIIGDIPIAKIERRILLKPVELKTQQGVHTAASRLFRYIKTVLNWAVNTGRLQASPMPSKYAAARAPVQRDRVLTDSEIRDVWNMEKDGVHPVHAALFRLLLLTGQRSEEISGLHRDEVAGDGVIHLPAARIKNGLAHAVPLGALGQGIVSGRLRDVNGEYLFPPTRAGTLPYIASHNVSQAMRKWLNRRGVVDHYTPHDLRRTVATRLNVLGFASEVVESLLNHISGHRSGVAGTYNRSKRYEQVREAVEAWEVEVKRIVGV